MALFVQGCATHYHEAYLPQRSDICEKEVQKAISSLLKYSHLKLFSPPFVQKSRLDLTTRQEHEQRSKMDKDVRFVTFHLFERGGACYLRREDTKQMVLLHHCHCQKVLK